MKKTIFILVAFQFACNPPKKNDETASEIKNDSSAVIHATSAISFDDKLFKPFQLPFNIDTVFILKPDTNEKVTYELLRYLGNEVLDHPMFNSLSYEINTFCKIDSLKAEGVHSEYVAKLDIGMTKESIAFRIGMVSMPNDAKLFLWGIESSSYEACPFHQGKTIIATFVNENKNNTHFIVGEISSAGDPPSMMSQVTTAKIFADGKIEIKSVTISDDIDTPGEEIATEKITLNCVNNKLMVKESKKDVRNSEKTN